MTADCSTAQQSSTNRPGWNDADRACDGVTDTDYRNPQHCAHTQSSSDNWWQVELLLAGPVAAVEIYFRSDCCRTCSYLICVYSIYFFTIYFNVLWVWVWSLNLLLKITAICLSIYCQSIYVKTADNLHFTYISKTDSTAVCSCNTLKIWLL